MTKQQATIEAQTLADEEGSPFFIVEDCSTYRAMPVRPDRGRVVEIVEPRGVVQ